MAAEYVKDQAPLAGMVICCTAILADQRHELALSATAMGAEWKYDLTSDVTHLIVGSMDTPKYKYVAKERPDVKIVLPTFINAVKESWMEGGGTDVEHFEGQYRMPTLDGLIICTTGFGNLEREEITTIVKQHGAQYRGDLTKEITHLISAKPEGNKYEHARAWGIKAVGREWLMDCIERGMMLDESLYDLKITPENRGIGAWVRLDMLNTNGKRPPQNERGTELSLNKRKLRRTMSAKLGNQQETLWADIASLGSVKAQHNQWQPQDERSSLKDESVAQDQGPEDVTPGAIVQPFRKPSAIPGVHVPSESNDQSRGLFRGALIYVHGFDASKTAILSTHLESNGARVCATRQELQSLNDSRNNYLIVPHDTPQDELPALPARALAFEKVTEFWVEHCLVAKALVNPDDQFLCTPFSHHIIDGFDDITMCSTGFKGIDLLHLTKTVILMGASYDEYLKPGVSVLVCNSKSCNQEKIDFAIANNVPTVSEKWLWACIETGSLEDFAAFAVESEIPIIPAEHRPQHPNVYKQSSRPARSFKSARALELDSRAPTVDCQKTIGPVQELVLKTSSKRGPFEEEDEDDGPPTANIEPEYPRPPTPEPVEPSSQPLREVSPEKLNSPKRPSQTNTNKIKSPVKEDAKSIHAATESINITTSAPSNTHLRDSIAALLAQKLSRQNSNAQEAPLSRRKRGLLGRATSASSSSLASQSLSRTSSLQALQPQPQPKSQSQSQSQSQSSQPLHLQQQHHHHHQQQYKDATKKNDPPPPPSQKIIYEDENARDERARLMKKLGGRIDVDVVLGEKGIGVVRDLCVDEGSVGARLRRRGK